MGKIHSSELNSTSDYPAILIECTDTLGMTYIWVSDEAPLGIGSE